MATAREKLLAGNDLAEDPWVSCERVHARYRNGGTSAWLRRVQQHTDIQRPATELVAGVGAWEQPAIDDPVDGGDVGEYRAALFDETAHTCYVDAANTILRALGRDPGSNVWLQRAAECPLECFECVAVFIQRCEPKGSGSAFKDVFTWDFDRDRS